MSDYSSVGPPQTQNFSQSTAFAAALQRAKEIASKIHPTGTKRSNEPDSSIEPETKKFNSSSSISIGGGGGGGGVGGGGGGGGKATNNSEYHSPNSSMSPAAMQAVQQAAAVAARLAQSIGNIVNEEIKLPEKIAGFINGRCGNDDELQNIQSASGCKIMLSRDSERVCTLSGAKEAVTHAKDLLNKLCNDNNASSAIESISCILIPPAGASGYPPYQEIMVPGSKVGLVIGKGGETIKMLQEKTGAKMVIIQDGPGQELVEKPLRISGDPLKIDHAKQLVFDLILEKDAYNNNNRGGFNTNNGPPPGGEQAEVFVPKTAVGVVIGKGGDMIKKIQGETGCKLQFIQGKGDGPGDRRCIISGTKQQVDDAKRTIEDLIESVMVKRSNQNNQNRNNNHNQSMANSNYGYGTDASQQPMREEVSFAVPASKCGIVIGRGGETIKLINQQSGAFCEMDRSAINPPSEKMFKMKGTSEQIEHARQLISEKIGVEISILTTRPISGVGNNGAGQNAGQPNNYGMQGNNPANMYGQQQQQWGYQQQMWDQSQQQGVAVNAAGQPDYSAQWIEYYKSIGLHREAEMIEQQLKMKQSTSQAVPMPSANGNAQMVVPSAAQQQQQAQNPTVAGGQNDYSKQWAEYYRSIGKIEEAEAIESQIKGIKTAGQSPSNLGQNSNASSVGSGNFAAGGQQPMAGNYNPQYAQYYAGAAANQNAYGNAQPYGAYGNYGAPQPSGQGQSQPNDKN